VKFKIVDSSDENEAQSEAFTPIAITFTQDTKYLQSADDMFTENALTHQLVTGPIQVFVIGFEQFEATDLTHFSNF
jgi:hypothetical protein